MENKSGYPHPQPGMAMPMPMPPTYDQSQYPPQPGMYPPMQHMQHHQEHHQQHLHHHQQQTHHIHYVPPPVITEQPPTVIMTPQVGPDPQMLTCPSCRQTTVSKMDYESSTRTHVMAGLCFLFGCWLCCWMPYCMDSCRNGNHYCTNCNAYLGTYRS